MKVVESVIDFKNEIEKVIRNFIFEIGKHDDSDDDNKDEKKEMMAVNL